MRRSSTPASRTRVRTVPTVVATPDSGVPAAYDLATTSATAPMATQVLRTVYLMGYIDDACFS